ncbi:Non-histone chromosomal protein 6 [Apophysomyces sp. BC1034]|nr:Non-histone chromosomal protein 6 [Apophysomyces sp. BC1021]KAG0186862.1 Non-histone chromosomal protein 6 [Apophysomyces sp. BC1034]
MTKAKDETVSKRASTLRERRKKPTEETKRPLSAYMLFSKERRPKVKLENSDASFGKDKTLQGGVSDIPQGQIGQILGQMWRALTPEEKKVYQDKAAEEKNKHTAATAKK